MNLVHRKRFRSPTLGLRLDNGQGISRSTLDEEPSYLQGLAGKAGRPSRGWPSPAPRSAIMPQAVSRLASRLDSL